MSYRITSVDELVNRLRHVQGFEDDDTGVWITEAYDIVDALNLDEFDGTGCYEVEDVIAIADLIDSARHDACVDTHALLELEKTLAAKDDEMCKWAAQVIRQALPPGGD